MITKKLLTTILLCFAIIQMQSQTTADFENFNLPADAFLNDSGEAGAFESGGVALPNVFTDAGAYSFWSGWCVSAMTDTLTPGFTNELSAITGTGAEGTDTYAVTYIFGSGIMNIIEQGDSKQIEGMYVTNNTYAYLSMQDGDGFAKKFGGETGDDPDYFYITVKKYLDGELSADSIDFYLADFRFEDNSQDYIVKDWTWLDLTSLGNVDSLQFTFSSSDVGGFGINTPTYFCVDEIKTNANDFPVFTIVEDTSSFCLGAASHNLDLLNIDAGGDEEQELSIDASSSNELIASNVNIDYESPNTEGVLSFDFGDEVGFANIDIVLNDGIDSVTQTFVVNLKDCTGITDIVFNNMLQLSPNPTTDQVTFEWKNEEEASLSLYNLNGQALMTQTVRLGQNQLDLQFLPKGSYVLRIEQRDGVYQDLIVKQ